MRNAYALEILDLQMKLFQVDADKSNLLDCGRIKIQRKTWKIRIEGMTENVPNTCQILDNPIGECHIKPPRHGSNTPPQIS